MTAGDTPILQKSPNPLDTQEVYLREYDALMAEIQNRMDKSHQLHVFMVAALGGLIPLVSYIDSIASNPFLANYNPYLLLLIAAMIFALLALNVVELDMGIMVTGRYIVSDLGPRIKQGTPEAEPFRWEVYWRKEMSSGLTTRILYASTAARYITGPLVALGLVIYYIYYATQLASNHEWLWFEIGVLSISILLVLLSITSSIFLYFKYGSSPELHNSK